MRNGYRLAAAALVLALAGAIAPSASALVVHGHRGHFFGVQPHRGINPAAVPGSIAAGQTTATRSRPDNGILTYHGGPVVHSSAPYLIFWVPSGESIPASSRTLMDRYFTDVAADSGKTDDVFGVSRQYTDASGFADYRQTFNSATHALIDTQPYPPTDTTTCSGSAYPTCITDAQLQQELQRLVAARGLPNDGPANAAELPQSAPIYFIVLPGDVDICGSGLGCASSSFCAYHSFFTDGNSNTLLYAAMPMLLAINNPKACQSDGNTAVQEPNGDPADLVIDDLSHEDNETITDPLGTSWWDPSSGNEEADGCSSYGSFSPSNDTDPNAYLPTLGGDAGAGTLYDQLIGGDQYYTQSEWSNGDQNCEMRPSAGTISPTFSEIPGPPYPIGSSITFDPTASTSTYPISSETWDFGDGSTPAFQAGSLTNVSHTYSAPGTYTVTLTLVDNRGNRQSTTQQVTIGPLPSFTYSPISPHEGTSVSFDGSGSVDPDPRAQITSYVWNFGDGSSDTETAATDNHTYGTYGTYTVTLTVTDNDGVSNTTSHQITVVDENPTASFTISPSQGPYATGQSIPFDGSGSSDPDGKITSYSWKFGDGATGTGAAGSHTYASSGTYTVTLTVTDSNGRSAAVSHQITAHSRPTASFGFSPPAPLTGTPVGFDGRGSSDPGVAIVSYAWNFGDGSTGSGATPSHTYSNPGNYTVTLTVTNSVGLTAKSSQEITIFAPPPTASFVVNTPHPAADVPVQFNGSSSFAPQGSITSYVWNFGDGSTARGVAPAHTYAGAGTYRVSLTIVSTSGLSATADDAVVVVTGGRIKKISVSTKRGLKLLAISLTGPGRLSVGTRRIAIAHAESIRVRITPNAAGRRRLQRTHRLSMIVPVTFTPQIGRPTKTRVSITFRR